ncbi:AC2 [Coccinia mosaic Virudhunagar virus]|nr:AC2 [Coccinia mosaic Virudhunagar virus]
MHSSSPSKVPSTPAGIKAQHRKSKRAIRRRRIDLKCGCSYYYSIDCHDHGFTHRGVHHCNSSREWRVYLDGTKSPLFQDNRPRSPSVFLPTGHHNNRNQIQPQPEESSADSQVFSNLQGLDWFTASDLAFFEGIQDAVLKYLDMLGVVSLNNVIRAVDHVLWNVIHKTEYVDRTYSIKFNVY